MSQHTYKVCGVVSNSGNSTINPLNGSGANAKWTINTNPKSLSHVLNGTPVYVEKDNLLISPEFTNHNITVLVYEDEGRTKLVAPTAGTIDIEFTDNGVDWGKNDPSSITFQAGTPYTRLGVCSVICNVRVNITGLAPSTYTDADGNDKGVYVEVLINSSN